MVTGGGSVTSPPIIFSGAVFQLSSFQARSFELWYLIQNGCFVGSFLFDMEIDNELLLRDQIKTPSFRRQETEDLPCRTDKNRRSIRR
jgi:hypothetical protein